MTIKEVPKYPRGGRFGQRPQGKGGRTTYRPHERNPVDPTKWRWGSFMYHYLYYRYWGMNPASARTEALSFISSDLMLTTSRLY